MVWRLKRVDSHVEPKGLQLNTWKSQFLNFQNFNSLDVLGYICQHLDWNLINHRSLVVQASRGSQFYPYKVQNCRAWPPLWGEYVVGHGRTLDWSPFWTLSMCMSMRYSQSLGLTPCHEDDVSEEKSSFWYSTWSCFLRQKQDFLLHFVDT